MGFRGMSPKQIARMMKKMGIEQEEIGNVKEVIFRFPNKEWVIAAPHVVVIRQPGGETYQITGSKTERGLETAERDENVEASREITVPVEDASLVASQAGVTLEEAIEALKRTGGDLAAAILELRRR
ncbi:MAG: nascent polypeptide-associated complex protein [Candidatus Thorarchaeota archaeon]